MITGILKNLFHAMLILLIASGIFVSYQNSNLSAKDVQRSSGSKEIRESDSEDIDGADEAEEVDEDDSDEGEDSGDVEEEEDSDEIFDSGYVEGWADADTLRVYGYGICKEKGVKAAVAKEKAKKAAVLNGQAKIVMLTGDVKKRATADGWIKEFSGIVKGAMIIWEWYDTEEKEYHVVLEVSFDR